MDDGSRLEFPISRTGDRFKLLALLAAELHDGDLLDIARCDYGDDAELHLIELRFIADRLAIPSPLEWHPREVLQLTRWEEAPKEETDDALIRMDRQRAFCCAVLLAAMDHPVNYHDGTNQTLVQLIESLGRLELSADEAAADLLIWLFRSGPEIHISEMAFLGLGLLYLVLADLRWSNAELMALIDWIMANEDAAPENWQNGPGASAHKTWLLSKTNYDQRHMKWRQLGPKLVERLTKHHSEQIIEKVKLIAFLLSKKS